MTEGGRLCGWTAGIHPAPPDCYGSLAMTKGGTSGKGMTMGGRLCGNDGEGEGNDGGPQPRRPWVPAYAGTTGTETGMTEGEAARE